MSAGAVGVARGRRMRAPTLGIVAVVIATQCVTTLARFPELLLISLHASETVDLAVLLLLTTGVGLVAVVVGLVAAISGRGRWWGVAAILIAILGNVSFLELTRSLVGAR